MIHIEITNQQAESSAEPLPVDETRIRQAVEMIVEDAAVADAQISVAIVDDSTIAQVHRDFLDLDEPTDVISFVLEEGPGSLEGEVVASADTARREAAAYGWSPEDELLLYVIHGTLHLVGYDDTTDTARPEMRRQEAKYLARLGIDVRHEEII